MVPVSNMNNWPGKIFFANNLMSILFLPVLLTLDASDYSYCFLIPLFALFLTAMEKQLVLVWIEMDFAQLDIGGLQTMSCMLHLRCVC